MDRGASSTGVRRTFVMVLVGEAVTAMVKSAAVKTVVSCMLTVGVFKLLKVVD